MMKKRLSPNQIFDIYEPKSTQPLEPWMESKLFWDKEPRKMSDQGLVKWTVGEDEYKFQASTDDIFWEHKNSWLTVRINKDKPNCVHLFDKKNGDFIGVIEPQLVLNKENKKEVLEKHSRMVNRLLAYEKKMRKADENVSEGLDPDYRNDELDLDALVLRKTLNEKES